MDNRLDFANKFLENELVLSISWKIRIIGNDYGSKVFGKIENDDDIDEFCNVLSKQIKRTLLINSKK